MLAGLADLAAIGAVPVDLAPTDERVGRAVRLIELASAQVVAYLAADDEDAVTSAYSAAQLTALAAVVAEMAARRLSASAAPSTEYFAQPFQPSIRMTRGDRIAVNRALGRGGSRSIDTVRDESSSFLTYSSAGVPEVSW